MENKDVAWQIHDRFFKGLFIYESVHKDFIKLFLQKYLQYEIDLTTLMMIRTESVDKNCDVSLADLIFDCKTSSGRQVYLLFEHKSKPEKNIQVQLEKYISTFKLDYLKKHPQAMHLVQIEPVVVYHGMEKWDISLELDTICERKGDEQICISQKYLLVDINHMSDEQFKGTPILKIFLLLLKYIRSTELLTKIDEILVLFNELMDDPNLKEYISLFTFYVESAYIPQIRENVVRKITDCLDTEDWNMSIIIEELKKRALKRELEKGREEWFANGIDKATEAMWLILTTNKSDETIAKETNVPIEKVREIRAKIKGV